MVVSLDDNGGFERYEAVEVGKYHQKFIELKFNSKKYIESGTHATVYSVRVPPNGCLLRALKVVNKPLTAQGRRNERDNLTEEIKILQRCNGHPNICRIIAFFHSHVDILSDRATVALNRDELEVPPSPPSDGLSSNEEETRTEEVQKELKERDEQYDKLYNLNILLEYFPTNLYNLIEHYKKDGVYTMPLLHCKLYAYQMLRGLAALHSNNVCHQDLKPSNLLVDPNSGVLKICDFSNAQIFENKQGQPFELKPFLHEVCSLFYRAPEHLVRASLYSLTFDLWSAGCTFGEILLGRILFPSNPIEPEPQMAEIMQVLGVPSGKQLKAMYATDIRIVKRQQIEQTSSLKRVLQGHLVHKNNADAKKDTGTITPFDGTASTVLNVPAEAVDLAERLLRYDPTSRLPAKDALAHPFFDDLRNMNTKFTDDVPLPEDLFRWTCDERNNFTPAELLKLTPNLI